MRAAHTGKEHPPDQLLSLVPIRRDGTVEPSEQLYNAHLA